MVFAYLTKTWIPLVIVKWVEKASCCSKLFVHTFYSTYRFNTVPKGIYSICFTQSKIYNRCKQVAGLPVVVRVKSVLNLLASLRFVIE